jgi:uncharacterized GH25 family protein
MKKFNSIVLSAACLMSMFASGIAHAHYLWLEPTKGGTALYFGEPDAELREKSPGKLDRIKAPQAYVNEAGGKPVAVDAKRANSHFMIASGKARTVMVAEEGVEVADLTRHGLGLAKSNYYARIGQTAGTDAAPLALDVQSNAPNTFTVLYRGQPVAKAKVLVIAPNTWTQEHVADDKGTVKINTPWRGQYVLHVLHIDKTAGDFGGKAYDNLRNHLTYTFTQTKGANGGPRLAPMHPME